NLGKISSNIAQYRREYRFRYLPPRFGTEIFLGPRSEISPRLTTQFPTHPSCASPFHNSFDTHDLIRVVPTYHQDEDDQDAQNQAIQDDNPTITKLIHVEYSLDDSSKTETPIVIEEDEKLMVGITKKLHKVPTEART
ncbi:hypothetical protein Tco_0934447, partial [Tanacetum coccineum]